MGPSALRLAGLDERLKSLGYEVQDLGNVTVAQPEATPAGPDRARFLPQIAQTCKRLGDLVCQAMTEGKMPLVLGGDHSVAVGTVAGIARSFHARQQKIGLIWVDAHADMNTPETSPSGNVHGMPLACCIGRGPEELTHLFDFAPKVDPRNVAIVGLRDVDRKEVPYVRETGVAAYTMRDIDERGLRAVMSEAIERASDGTDGFHVSFDMDAVDPREAPGVGTPVRGGLTYREAHLTMEILGDCEGLAGMEIVEVNPVLDIANQTAILGVELVLSALGKRIL
jgi:arginase